MATETSNTHNTGQNSLTIGLAFVAGTGLVLIGAAAVLGVVQGEAADSTTLIMLFSAGVVLLVTGVVAWGSVVRPWENFDDINQPQEDDHHHIEAYSEEEPGEINVEEPIPPQTTSV